MKIDYKILSSSITIIFLAAMQVASSTSSDFAGQVEFSELSSPMDQTIFNKDKKKKKPRESPIYTIDDDLDGIA